MTELDPVYLASQGWMPVTNLQKDGNLYLLLVKTDFVNEPRNTEDDAYHRTIGFNTLDDMDEERWLTAGWCWSHDCFTHATPLDGDVLYYQELPSMSLET